MQVAHADKANRTVQGHPEDGQGGRAGVAGRWTAVSATSGWKELAKIIARSAQSWPHDDPSAAELKVFALGEVSEKHLKNLDAAVQAYQETLGVDAAHAGRARGAGGLSRKTVSTK